ncbi:MAG: ABC transporter ATP-binding protein [Oscillospiraceae bacterium]
MIQVSHLTKYYGDFLAVNDLSFEIQDGHVYGFLGPNGAGKSTTMNIMTGCLSPTDGTVKIGGFDILEQPEAAKKLIGYLPEQPPLYPNETPQEYLTFVGEAKGLRGKELREEIDSAVQSAGIENVRDRLIGTLSKGYRQRVGIAQALLGKPQVIILDEPTVGLDPIQIIEIRDFIKELGKTHTVILSSHILSEVQAVCEQVLIISKGKLVAFDTPENLEKLLLASNGVTFQVEADKADAESILAQAEGLSGWEIKEADGVCSVTADLADGQDAKAVCGKLTMAFAAKGLPVFEMRTKKANLEDVFLELTESGAAEDMPQDFAESDTESEAGEE